MKMTHLKTVLSFILCIVLVAAIALFTTSCNDNKKETPSTASTTVSVSETTVLGEGKKQFAFTVTDYDGNETAFEIHTDKTIVGEALLEVGLISGDEGPYGLYVKEVNGISADYDKDQAYWAFYVDGEMASSGVDTTEIEEGKIYSFVVTKA